jgi:hypothetical protein
MRYRAPTAVFLLATHITPKPVPNVPGAALCSSRSKPDPVQEFNVQGFKGQSSNAFPSTCFAAGFQDIEVRS